MQVNVVKAWWGERPREPLGLTTFSSRGRSPHQINPLLKFFATLRLGDFALNSIRMLKVKDTLRATVNLSFDGRVFKAYHGPDAQKRFENEVRVLKFLETRGCSFVPRLLEADEKNLRIVTTNCGSRVERLDAVRQQEIFAELEKFGVHHDDADIRNVTYRQSDGRFCVIDFEFATILG